MNRDEAKRLLEQVRANMASWDACDGPHELVDLTPEKTIGKRWRCSKCGGECDSVAKSYYEQGLRHGRGMPTQPGDA